MADTTQSRRRDFDWQAGRGWLRAKTPLWMKPDDRSRSTELAFSATRSLPRADPAPSRRRPSCCITALAIFRVTHRWRKPDSNHWYRVMRSRFRERLMLPPLDFPPPEKSALTGDENADASRGTDGSNPVPSSGESGANLSLAGIRLSRSRSRGFPRLSGPGRAA